MPDRKDSAILVPLFLKDDEVYILFTKRSFDVAHHKGQISFPGGVRSEEDNSPLDTALRESWEEVGIEPTSVEILGELDDVLTSITNYLIHPFVGVIPYPYKFTVNPNEILELIEVPVKALMDKASFKEERDEGEWGDSMVYFYKYRKKVIWGATARILKQLLDAVNCPCV